VMAIESRPRQGVTVRFTLPVGQAGRNARRETAAA
jgi:hypothetical protein